MKIVLIVGSLLLCVPAGFMVFYFVKKFREKKKLEKEINRPEYIDDNSYNISYVYIFNILADNNYFPDKTLNLLDQEYQLLFQLTQ